MTTLGRMLSKLEGRAKTLNIKKKEYHLIELLESKIEAIKIKIENTSMMSKLT